MLGQRHRLVKRAHIGNQGQIAVVIELLGDEKVWMQAKLGARLRALWHVDLQKLVLLDANDATHGQILGVQVRVGRVRLTARVGHEHVVRIATSIHVEHNDGLERPPLRPRGRRRRRRLPRAEGALQVCGVELRREREELNRVTEGRVRVHSREPQGVGLNDVLARGGAQAPLRQNQVELTDGRLSVQRVRWSEG